MKKRADDLLQVLMQANQLKRTARTGWIQRGVSNAESVAAHSYGVAFITLLLSQVLEKPIKLERALAMALLHDLPESLTTDIPKPAWRHLPSGSKYEVETGAIKEIFGETDFGEELLALWEDLMAAESYEAKLVHDADKLDMFLQALVYEEQSGNRHLQEFWDSPTYFYFPQNQFLYDVLRRRRKA